MPQDYLEPFDDSFAPTDLLLSKEEAKLLLDFMAHQFISYSNNGLIVLIRRMEKFVNG